MLTFAPHKRITGVPGWACVLRCSRHPLAVEEALAHPYLKFLHDPKDEVSAVCIVALRASPLRGSPCGACIQAVCEREFTFDIEKVPMITESLKGASACLSLPPSHFASLSSAHLWLEVCDIHPELKKIPLPKEALEALKPGYTGPPGSSESKSSGLGGAGAGVSGAGGAGGGAGAAGVGSSRSQSCRCLLCPDPVSALQSD